MKRTRGTKKLPPLEIYLKKNHRDMCGHWIFSGDKKCTCGRDTAFSEYAYLRAKSVACDELEKAARLAVDGESGWLKQLQGALNNLDNIENEIS